MPRKPRPRNWDQERARIDRGESRDKVPYPDPATVPLGTDAEAGGFNAHPDVLEAGVRSDEPSGQPAGQPKEQQPAAPRAAWVIGAAAILLLVVLLLLTVL